MDDNDGGSGMKASELKPGMFFQYLEWRCLCVHVDDESSTVQFARKKAGWDATLGRCGFQCLVKPLNVTGWDDQPTPPTFKAGDWVVPVDYETPNFSKWFTKGVAAQVLRIEGDWLSCFDGDACGWSVYYFRHARPDEIPQPAESQVFPLIPQTPTDAQIYDACCTYRHDFGLLNAKEKELCRSETVWWLDAWRKTILQPSYLQKELEERTNAPAMQLREGWRWLDIGEVIQQGDEYIHPQSDWKPADFSIGHPVAQLFAFARREVPPPVEPVCNWTKQQLENWEQGETVVVEPDHIVEKVADSDGWIEWRGGECPVDGDLPVQYRMRDGDESTCVAKDLRWHHKLANGDIVAYRIVTPAPKQYRPFASAELTFAAFRKARCIKWHPEGIESWSPSDWLTAVTGELGELASLLKMRNRERDGLPGNKFSPTQKQVADELADVVTYLDLLAAALGVDLGKAAVEKFNEVSVRVGFPDRIELCVEVRE